jgi:hypothetical protein
VSEDVVMSRDTDLIAKVRGLLEFCASEGKLISFSEIESRIGERVVLGIKFSIQFTRN